MGFYCCNNIAKTMPYKTIFKPGPGKGFTVIDLKKVKSIMTPDESRDTQINFIQN
jgi:hypothetical protein